MNGHSFFDDADVCIRMNRQINLIELEFHWSMEKSRPKPIY